MKPRTSEKEKNPPNKRPKKEEQFFIPRDDPYDPYKPNSRKEITITALTQKYPLDKDDHEMLQEIAADYDHCLPTDIIEGAHKRPFISKESQVQLLRLPTWLRTMIESKYEDIHKKYGHQTHNFLKLLGNRIDIDRTVFNRFDDIEDLDVGETEGIEKQFVVEDKDLEQDGKAQIKAGDLLRVAQACKV